MIVATTQACADNNFAFEVDQHSYYLLQADAKFLDIKKFPLLPCALKKILF